MKTVSLDRSTATNYLKRAEQCFRTSNLAFENNEWDASVISAIHAGISSADAICIFKKGVRNASENHRDSLALLQSIDSESEEIKRAVKHLSELLSVKTDAEYGDRLATHKDAESSLKHAERILSFVKEVLKSPI